MIGFLPMTDVLSKLISILRLRKAADRRWEADSEITSWGRIYGGQVIAQAIAAAHQTVDDRPLHAIHGNFMRVGDCHKAIAAEVQESFTGASFATRHVVIEQADRPIFTLSASFQRRASGFDHQDAMPDVPPPEELLDEQAMAARFPADTAAHVRRYWLNDAPFERRMVWLDRYQASTPLPAVNALWVRTRRPVPAEQWLHDALLGYISDLTLLETSMFPHAKSVASSDIRATSLDHSLWIHHPPKVDEWLLYHQQSPFAGGGRGLSFGAFYDRSGRRGASSAQEGMIRWKPKA